MSLDALKSWHAYLKQVTINYQQKIENLRFIQAHFDQYTLQLERSVHEYSMLMQRVSLGEVMQREPIDAGVLSLPKEVLFRGLQRSLSSQPHLVIPVYQAILRRQTADLQRKLEETILRHFTDKKLFAVALEKIQKVLNAQNQADLLSSLFQDIQTQQNFVNRIEAEVYTLSRVVEERREMGKQIAEISKQIEALADKIAQAAREKQKQSLSESEQALVKEARTLLSSVAAQTSLPPAP